MYVVLKVLERMMESQIRSEIDIDNRQFSFLGSRKKTQFVAFYLSIWYTKGVAGSKKNNGLF